MRAAGRLKEKDEWIFDPPEIWPGWAWLLEGYDEVCTDRQLGFDGPGPVPYRSIRQWSADEGLSAYEAQLFHAVVRELDAEYVDFRAAKADKG